MRADEDDPLLTIIGIDPGLASTGYGVITVNGAKSVHRAHGVIATRPGIPGPERLLVLYDALAALLDRFRPDEAGVEDIYFAKNSKTYTDVAQAKGVVLLALARHGVTVKEYSPLVIKRAVAGNGRAEKSQVQELVRIILGLSACPTPDHASDALAAAICHGHQALFGTIKKRVERIDV